MDGFTIVDFGVIVIIALSAILAYSRGLVREGTAIAGWVIAAILAFIFADVAQPVVRQIPYLGDVLGDSCELLILASFAIIFAIALLVVSIFTPLFSSIVQKSILRGLDKNLGLHVKCTYIKNYATNSKSITQSRITHLDLHTAV